MNLITKKWNVESLINDAVMCIACVQADKLLSQDFKSMLDNTISFLPRDRQIMLYSATFPVTVEEFIVRC